VTRGVCDQFGHNHAHSPTTPRAKLQRGLPKQEFYIFVFQLGPADGLTQIAEIRRGIDATIVAWHLQRSMNACEIMDVLNHAGESDLDFLVAGLRSSHRDYADRRGQFVIDAMRDLLQKQVLSDMRAIVDSDFLETVNATIVSFACYHLHTLYLRLMTEANSAFRPLLVFAAVKLSISIGREAEQR
jgi:hypothetical protein